uniref:Uncharacterized protein n=1 Tax=Arion vulgaris TaxID=1028688 RepID=A0A0B7B517_9EUPU
MLLTPTTFGEILYGGVEILKQTADNLESQPKMNNDCRRIIIKYILFQDLN